MHFASLFIFLCLLLTAFYIIGLLLFLTDHEPDNNCEMTYMFEYPQYIVSFGIPSLPKYEPNI